MNYVNEVNVGTDPYDGRDGLKYDRKVIFGGRVALDFSFMPTLLHANSSTRCNPIILCMDSCTVNHVILWNVFSGNIDQLY